MSCPATIVVQRYCRPHQLRWHPYCLLLPVSRASRMANSIVNLPGVSTGAVQAPRDEATIAAPARNQPTDVVTAQPAADAELSTLSAVARNAAKLASSMTSYRADLVSKLKTQIAEGTYRPDPQAVAGRIAAA